MCQRNLSGIMERRKMYSRIFSNSLNPILQEQKIWSKSFYQLLRDIPWNLCYEKSEYFWVRQSVCCEKQNQKMETDGIFEENHYLKESQDKNQILKLNNRLLIVKMSVSENQVRYKKELKNHFCQECYWWICQKQSHSSGVDIDKPKIGK